MQVQTSERPLVLLGLIGGVYYAYPEDREGPVGPWLEKNGCLGTPIFIHETSFWFDESQLDATIHEFLDAGFDCVISGGGPLGI